MPDWFRMQRGKAGRRFKLTDIVAVIFGQNSA